MEDFDKIEWHIIWDIIKDTVLPHTGTLILNTVLFSVLGLAISIVYVVILYKKGVFRRNPKYYNWGVKLYIPMLIAVFLYFFGSIGFITGVYKVLQQENEAIASSVCNSVLQLSFESEESKNEFIINLQQSAREVNDNSTKFEDHLKLIAQQSNTGFSVIDAGKNKLADVLIKKYGDDIFKISIYGMLNLSKANAHLSIDEPLSYEEFSTGLDFLLEVGHKDIEQAARDKVMAWYDALLSHQYKALIVPQLILLLILISLPLIEFFIYKKWGEPRVVEEVEVPDTSK